jgi:hypothetical protein
MNPSQVVAEVTPIGFSTIKYQYFIVYAAINLFLTLPGLSTHMCDYGCC